MKEICKTCRYYIPISPCSGICDNVDVKVSTVYPNSSCSFHDDKNSKKNRCIRTIRRAILSLRRLSLVFTKRKSGK